MSSCPFFLSKGAGVTCPARRGPVAAAGKDLLHSLPFLLTAPGMWHDGWSSRTLETEREGLGPETTPEGLTHCYAKAHSVAPAGHTFVKAAGGLCTSGDSSYTSPS